MSRKYLPLSHGGERFRKVKMLLDFTSHLRAIADPWYTGNFDETYSDIAEGCTALLKAIGGGKI